MRIRMIEREVGECSNAKRPGSGEAERKRLYDRIQEIELRDLPYFVLRWQALIDLRSTALHGVKPAPSTSTFWNVADWTLR